MAHICSFCSNLLIRVKINVFNIFLFKWYCMCWGDFLFCSFFSVSFIWCSACFLYHYRHLIRWDRIIFLWFCWQYFLGLWADFLLLPLLQLFLDFRFVPLLEFQIFWILCAWIFFYLTFFLTKLSIYSILSSTLEITLSVVIFWWERPQRLLFDFLSFHFSLSFL